MRFFRREVELTLKMLGGIVLVGLIVLPLAWGYEQRRQAKAWQSVACAYRIKEIMRSSPFVGTVERGKDACATLARLGLQLSDSIDYAVLSATATTVATRAR